MMKKYALLCYLMVWSTLVFAQTNMSFPIYIEDALGRTDTLHFGFKDTATFALDTAYGEQNIYGNTWDSLDARFIQRDSLSSNCLIADFYSNNQNLKVHFPQNIDTKVDYREEYGNEQNLNFELFINAYEYPVVVRGNFAQLSTHYYDGWSYMVLLNDTCGTKKMEGISSISNSTNDTLFVLDSSFYSTIVFHFEGEVSIHKTQKIASILELFPNPAKNLLTINSEKALTGTLKIIDIHGKNHYQKTLDNKQILDIDISKLTKGIYIVQYLDEVENTLSSSKFVKI